MMQKSIDIVIPTKNSKSKKDYSIFFTLNSLLAQRQIDTNIIIVDDQSDDDTKTQIEIDFRNQDIIIVDGQGEGAAQARNLGSKYGKSEYILFIDDDTVLSNDQLLKNTLDYVDGRDFACGSNRLWTPLNWNKYIHREDTYMSWQNILSKISYLPKGVDRITGHMDLTHVSFIGNYGLVKRDVFENIGGFPDLYKGWGLEDTHLMYMLCLRKSSYCLLKNCGIKVFHLNHSVGKYQTFISNLNKFVDYQKQVGISFSEAAFFDEFDGINPVLSPIL